MTMPFAMPSEAASNIFDIVKTSVGFLLLAADHSVGFRGHARRGVTWTNQDPAYLRRRILRFLRWEYGLMNRWAVG